MKKIIASVLSLAFIFALAACGSNGGTKAPEEAPVIEAEEEASSESKSGTGGMMAVSDETPAIEGDELEVVPANPKK